MRSLKYILLFVILMTINAQSLVAQSESSVQEKEQEVQLMPAMAKLLTTEQKENNSATTETETEEGKKKWGVNFDGTLVSRFIWRGLVLGDYPSVQSSVTFSKSGFFIGAWASYSLGPAERGGASSNSVPVAENYKEIIPYIGYGFKINEKSKLTLLFLTHYNPNVGEFFNFNNEPTGGGAALTNRVEFRTQYNYGKFDFFGGWDFVNDPTDNSSLYLEVGYTFDFPKNIKVRPFVSGVPNKNYYTTDGEAKFTQVGWYTSKSIALGKEVELLLKVDMVYNPDRDQFNAAIGSTFKL